MGGKKMGNPSVMGVLSQPPVSQRGGFCSPQPQHACPPGRGPWERRLAALKLGLLSRVIGAIFPFYGHFWRAGSSRQTLSPAITMQMRSVPPAEGGLPPRAPRTKRPCPAPRSARPRRSQPSPSAGGVPGARPGTMEASAVAVTGRCAPRPGPRSPHLRRRSALRSARAREPAWPPAREGTERFEPAATRPRPRGPRAAPAGGSSCGRARPGPPASPPALQAVARRGLGARAGTRAARSPPGAAGARAHKGTRATDREGARGPWGVCLPDEGGGGHTRRDTWEQQTPL